MTETELAPRKHRFALEYLKDMNGAKAARRAGYSANRAAIEAVELLKQPAVAALIDKLKAERNERLQITADSELDFLQDIRDADWNDCLNDDGTIRPVAEWPLIWRQHLLPSMKVKTTTETDKETGEVISTTGVVEVKHNGYHAKAQDLILRHVKVQALRDNVTVTVDDPAKRAELDAIRVAMIPANAIEMRRYLGAAQRMLKSNPDAAAAAMGEAMEYLNEMFPTALLDLKANALNALD